MTKDESFSDKNQETIMIVLVSDFSNEKQKNYQKLFFAQGIAFLFWGKVLNEESSILNVSLRFSLRE